jgi:hypothetical protein
MGRLLRRLTARHVFFSWIAYWAALAVVKLTPAALVIWQISRSGGKGDVSAALTDDVLKLTVTAAGSTTWTGSISLLPLAFMLAGPPIVLWACWLLATSQQRSSRGARSPEQLNRGDELPLRRDDRARSERLTEKSPG